jgi:hypothetical protein
MCTVIIRTVSKHVQKCELVRDTVHAEGTPSKLSRIERRTLSREPRTAQGNLLIWQQDWTVNVRSALVTSRFALWWRDVNCAKTVFLPCWVSLPDYLSTHGPTYESADTQVVYLLFHFYSPFASGTHSRSKHLKFQVSAAEICPDAIGK